jgi:site-specific DNA-methyltransferase (adenine-specific)
MGSNGPDCTGSKLWSGMKQHQKADTVNAARDRMKQESAAEWVDTSKLTPWRDNPRQNDGEAVDAVVASIKRFGFASPIIARMDGEVIAGHTRLKAALKLGLDRVPVRYMDLDPADAKLLALADNRVGEIADWDDDRLSDILNELKADGVDLEGLGWSEDELAEIMALGEEPEELPMEADLGDLDALPEDVPAITQAGEVVQLGRHTLTCGDCIEVMRGLPDNSVDAVVTDPPYGIGFMGKGWDCAVPGEDFAVEALRVLKPGGHLIAFAATRTVHRLTVAIEDAGFEIRDQIAWLQWQGFPKSHNVSIQIDKAAGAMKHRGKAHYAYATGKDFQGRDMAKPESMPPHEPITEDAKKWEGWGTALKPSQEPAILARKPLEGTVAENVLRWGVGGINVDGCRIAYGDPAWPGPGADISGQIRHNRTPGMFPVKAIDIQTNDLGRWPANIYQCPKASRSEREAGCEDLPGRSGAAAVERQPGTAGVDNPRAGAGRTAEHVKNHHPTVKPTALMQWLVRLVTPKGAVVLEPFCGSGTTLIAAELEGVTCWAIEQDPGYCDIIRARHGGISEAE